MTDIVDQLPSNPHFIITTNYTGTPTPAELMAFETEQDLRAYMDKFVWVRDEALGEIIDAARTMRRDPVDDAAAWTLTMERVMPYMDRGLPCIDAFVEVWRDLRATPVPPDLLTRCARQPEQEPTHMNE
jgi:hypothetical protein